MKNRRFVRRCRWATKIQGRLALDGHRDDAQASSDISDLVRFLADCVSLQAFKGNCSADRPCIDVLKAKWPDGRDLSDVPTRLRPVEMPRIAGQNDDGSGRKRLQLIGVELITQADVEDPGDHGIDSILRVPVWH
jgi:hypothetical protein